MGNVAILNAASVRRWAFEPLVELGSQNSFQRSAEFCRSAPDVSEVVVLCPPKADTAGSAAADAWVDRAKIVEASEQEGLRVVDLDAPTTGALFAALERLAVGHDHVIYAHADTPLLDAALLRTMYANHQRYHVDYSFADGYPLGLAAEVLRAESITAMARLAADPTSAATPLQRDSVFEVIKRDINAFDLETEISPLDQRLLRVVLAMDSARNAAQLRVALAHGARDAATAAAVLQEHPQVMRSLPAYVSVQVVDGCPQACSYCPYGVSLTSTGKTDEMAVERFAAIATQIAEFCGDAMLAVSLWGEPSLHSQFDELAAAVSELPGLQLLVETAGVGWDRGVLDRVAGLPRPPQWILSLDSSEASLYRQLRGEGYDEAVATATHLLEIAPQRTYVQAVRMKENEEQLETFYRAWKEKTPNVIIQKYDRFADTLPDRQVADLSPLERHPCWHLKRDLAVLLDGSVPMCREDLRRDHLLGNLETDGIAAVWERGQEIHQRHLDQDYPEICRRCDEYYTYNN